MSALHHCVEKCLSSTLRGIDSNLIRPLHSLFLGDTAANSGILTLLNSLEQTKDVNVGIKTACASAAAAAFRIV